MTLTTYDRLADALYVSLGASHQVARTCVLSPGVHLDLDATGRIIGLEVIGVAGRLPAEALQEPHCVDLVKRAASLPPAQHS